LDTYYPQCALKPLQWVWETFDYDAVDMDYFLKIRTDDIRNKVNGQ
jgi:hypothetical protein